MPNENEMVLQISKSTNNMSGVVFVQVTNSLFYYKIRDKHVYNTTEMFFESKGEENPFIIGIINNHDQIKETNCSTFVKLSSVKKLFLFRYLFIYRIPEPNGSFEFKICQRYGGIFT